MGLLDTAGALEVTSQDFGKATETDLEVAAQYGRMLEIALCNRNRKQALSIVDQGFAAMDPPMKSGYYQTPLAEIIDVRLANILETHCGAVVIADLLAMSEEAIARIPNWGAHSMLALYRAMLKSAISYVDAVSSPAVKLAS